MALAVCLVVPAACGQATQTAHPETTSSPSGKPPPGSATTDPDTPTSSSEVDVRRDGVESALVTGVRYATHDTYDRVVVDLKGDMPGYNVKWVDELVEDGSGKTIDVRGGAYLQVTIFPANAHTQDGKPTWGDDLVYPAKLGNLTDIVRTGDFEGHVGIGLVLARRAAFEVKEVDSPSRLIVDVAH